MSKLAPFDPVNVEDVEVEGRSGIEFNSEPGDMRVGGVTAVDSGLVDVQVSRQTQESPSALHHYLIDAATGEGTYVTDELSWIHDVLGDRIYAVRHLPFPQVNVYSLQK